MQLAHPGVVHVALRFSPDVLTNCLHVRHARLHAFGNPRSFELGHDQEAVAAGRPALPAVFESWLRPS